MRVIAYTDSAGIGGAEISLSHLVATASNEFEIIIVGVSQTVIDAIAARRPQAMKVILPAKGLSGLIAHLRTFYRLKPHVIHCNLCTPWAGAIALAAALWLPNVRIVRVDQLPLRTTELLTLLRTRFLSLRLDAHVAVGEASARRMEDFYALGRDSVISIPNCIPDSEPVLEPPSSDQTIVVASVGRLDAMKAHDVLIRAIAQVQNVKAFILGDGELRTYLEELAADLGVGDRICFYGWQNHPRTYLPNCDVFVMPSRSEGFPLAMVEAMLAARPVIATRVGSMPEAVIAGKTGLLIDKNDVEGLAQALQQLRDDPVLRRQLGQQAREMAVAHFTVEAMTTRYEQLWRSLIVRPAAPRWCVPRPKD
ncbi:MAG: glycosyltransferase family 4 protein [Oscillatoriales cyanobacterium C42_A2020_001]|nr:glycosyltransferase family 4 protein [Leptolyngbyaceae cyanobacterium C42_A2020_001]